MLLLFMNFVDMDLSELSCYAAGEIDDDILGRRRGFGAVRELAYRMEGFSMLRVKELEATDVMIYWDAYKGKSEVVCNRVDELQDRVFSDSQKLRSVLKGTNKEKGKLRGFCLDVSRCALYYEWDSRSFSRLLWLI